MKVRLSPNCFAPDAVKSRPFFLPSIFESCLGRHQLDEPATLEASGLFQAWREARSADERDVIDAVVRASRKAEAREVIDVVIIADVDSSNWELTPPKVGPEEILSLLHAPLTVLVENEINDGAFVRAIGFGFDRDTFLDRERRGQVRFEHAGGSSMRALIVARASDRIRAHRTWAIFDCDALVPGKPSKEAAEKVATCKKHGIRCHMLHRRAIENYLPHEDVDESIPLSDVPTRKAAGAFRRLRPEQRAHYNLKEGFEGDSARLQGQDREDAPAVSALFTSVPTADSVALAAGFGKDIARLFVPEPARGRLGISEERRRRDDQETEMVPLFRALVRSL